MNEDLKKSYKLDIRNILLKFILPASVSCFTFLIDLKTGVIVSVIALFWAYYHELSSYLLRREFYPLDRLGRIIEITSDSLVNDIVKELVRLSLTKIDNELDYFRNEIITKTISQLRDICNSKTCDFSSSSKFYTWILERVGRYGQNDFIDAVFVFKDGTLPNDMTETEREKKFSRMYISAMKRGVNIRRYFIGNRCELCQPSGSFADFILSHIETDSKNTNGFFVDKDNLMKTDPGLLKNIKDGFTIFNKKTVVCDHLTSDRPRGTLKIDREKEYYDYIKDLDGSGATPLYEVLAPGVQSVQR